MQDLKNERRYLLNGKMKKAEENRQRNLDNIRRKAHEEDEKLREIAFINKLQVKLIIMHLAK